MDDSQFIKNLQLAPGFEVPRRLIYEEPVLTAITREDVADDVRGINTSMELIRRTRGGGRPTEPVSEDFNYLDAVWHELEFRDSTSFTHVVRDAGGGYLGCVHLYPLGRR